MDRQIHGHRSFDTLRSRMSPERRAANEAAAAEMNTKLRASSRVNMARLDEIDEIVRLAEEASPKLKRRSERFARALTARQDRAFAKILARPGSKAYHDYVEIPADFGVEP